MRPGRAERKVGPRERISMFRDGGDPVKAISHAGVAKCLRFIRSNFGEPIGLSDLQRVAGLSVRGLHKAFRKHTGLNPGKVLRRYRIEQAKLILETNDLPMSRIAQLCGFRSANTFCIAFRNAVGVAPKQFQKTLWRDFHLENCARQNLDGRSRKTVILSECLVGGRFESFRV